MMGEGILADGDTWRSAIYSDISTLNRCCRRCSTDSIHSLLILELEKPLKKDEVEIYVCGVDIGVGGYGD